ncbi:MAG: hypothetical protein ACFCUI_10460 [Bernardetiaceae bacterium]
MIGWRVWVYGNFHIALGAVLMVWRSYNWAGFAPSLPILALAFFGTMTTYKLCCLSEMGTGTGDRFAFLKQHQSYYRYGLALSVGASLFFLPWTNPLLLSGVVHLGLISVLYTLPLSWIGWPALRNIPFVKTLLVAYVWAGVGVGLPLLSELPWTEIWRYGLAQLLFVLGLTLPFDIRDTHSDTAAGLPTFANRFGLRCTQILASLALIVAFWLLLPDPGTLPERLTYLIAFGGVWGATPERPEVYYTGFLDGLLGLPAVLSLAMWVRA